MSPERYKDDRVFIYLDLSTSADTRAKDFINELKKTNHPVLHYTLDDPYDIVKEIYRWEVATAVVGALLEINPFDQPDVQSAKNCTIKLLTDIEKNGAISIPPPSIKTDEFSVWFSTAAYEIVKSDDMTLEASIEKLIRGASASDYFGILSYTSIFNENKSIFTKFTKKIQSMCSNAVQSGYGPRYLHSTGQLHKGGSNKGIFFIITDNTEKLKIPGKPYSFNELIDAQSRGDFDALNHEARRAVYIHCHKSIDSF